jgi:hypothetical protein
VGLLLERSVYGEERIARLHAVTGEMLRLIYAGTVGGQ